MVRKTAVRIRKEEARRKGLLGDDDDDDGEGGAATDEEENADAFVVLSEMRAVGVPDVDTKGGSSDPYVEFRLLSAPSRSWRPSTARTRPTRSGRTRC